MNKMTAAMIQALTAHIYELDEMGGNLHAIIDDGNLEDCFFEDDAPSQEVGGDELHKMEALLYTTLKAISYEDRIKAMRGKQ